MPVTNRNPLTLDLSSSNVLPNREEPHHPPPPQTPFMENANKENIPPPRPRTRRVVPMHSPSLSAITPTQRTSSLGAAQSSRSQIRVSGSSADLGQASTTFNDSASRAQLWKLQRPLTAPMHVDRMTGLWGRDATRRFVGPDMWEHPSSECLLLTAELDEEARTGEEGVELKPELECYHSEMQKVHRNLLFARFRKRS